MHIYWGGEAEPRAGRSQAGAWERVQGGTSSKKSICSVLTF